jgi:hypothetical protein
MYTRFFLFSFIQRSPVRTHPHLLPHINSTHDDPLTLSLSRFPPALPTGPASPDVLYTFDSPRKAGVGQGGSSGLWHHSHQWDPGACSRCECLAPHHIVCAKLARRLILCAHGGASPSPGHGQGAAGCNERGLVKACLKQGKTHPRQQQLMHSHTAC